MWPESLRETVTGNLLRPFGPLVQDRGTERPVPERPLTPTIDRNSRAVLPMWPRLAEFRRTHLRLGWSCQPDWLRVVQEFSSGQAEHRHRPEQKLASEQPRLCVADFPEPFPGATVQNHSERPLKKPWQRRPQRGRWCRLIRWIRPPEYSVLDAATKLRGIQILCSLQTRRIQRTVPMIHDRRCVCHFRTSPAAEVG